MKVFTPNIDKLTKNRNISALMKYTDHWKPDVRIDTFRSLYSLLPPAEIRDKLRFMLDDSDPRVKAVVVFAFSHLGETDLNDHLKSIIVNGAKKDKIEALRLLSEYSGNRKTEVSDIIALALNERDSIVEIQAIRTIGELRDRVCLHHVIDRLNDRRINIRLESARALGKFGNDEVVVPLIGSLMDNSKTVRMIAHDALLSIGSELALKAVRDAPYIMLVNKMNSNRSTREDTVRFIGKNKIKEALPLLLKACHDDYKVIRIEALRSIAMLRDKSATETVIRLIEDQYWDVRIEAIKCLERLPSNESLSAVESATGDKNSNVREEAKRAYYNMKGRLEVLENRKNTRK